MRLKVVRPFILALAVLAAGPATAQSPFEDRSDGVNKGGPAEERRRGESGDIGQDRRERDREPSRSRPSRGGGPSPDIVAVCTLPGSSPEERIEACRALTAVEGLPDTAKAFAYLGLADGQRELDDDAAALEAIDQAVRLGPQLAAAHLARAAILMDLDRAKDAIGAASRGIDLDRRNPMGYVVRAEAYLRNDEAAFALGDVDEALQIAPDVARFHLLKVFAELALERNEDALKSARAALRLDPDLIEAYLIRARIYVTQEKYARAVADATRAVELEPNNTSAQETASIVFTELARFDEALAAADKLVELKGDDVNALNGRCWIKALIPDPVGALPDCEAALKADPDYFQARDSRAFVYWQLGRMEEAQADLDRAAELSPDFWDWTKREERFDVVLARRYLRALGHYDGRIDGDFDDMMRTEDAVKAYQAKAGLAETGAVDKALVARLAREVAE